MHLHGRSAYSQKHVTRKVYSTFRDKQSELRGMERLEKSRITANTQQEPCSFNLVFQKVEQFSSLTDKTPPSFNGTCPNNTVFYATECSSRALFTWTEPIATDNSEHVSISYPGIRPPVNLSIGLYNVMYSAIDSSGNRANCTFIVQVLASKSRHLIAKIYYYSD